MNIEYKSQGQVSAPIMVCYENTLFGSCPGSAKVKQIYQN